MNKKVTKKTLLEGTYEDVIQIGDHYYLSYKKDKIAILPYTIDTKGLLDKIGVVEDWNYVENEKAITLINGYPSTDDGTDMVAANRLLFDIIDINVKDALNWMYLGSLYNILNSDSTIKLYAVDITDINIKADEELVQDSELKKFKMLSSEKVIQTDDILFLAGFFRLFKYFYVSSLSDDANK